MQSLFSEHWHVVRHLTPKLRDSVQVLPRRLRGKDWVILHDPMSHKFVRLTPQAWQVVKLMDGVKSTEVLWDQACEQARQQDAAPLLNTFAEQHTGRVINQNELVQLLGQLYSNDLLQTQVSADAEEMYRRYKKQKFNKLKQSFLNPISIKIPLLYPDSWFEKHQAKARRLFSYGMLVLWLLVVLPALFLAWQNWENLTSNLSDRVLSSSNLLMMWFTYPALKAIHECAHGFAIKAWGGHVREMGLMFILFMPIPYVDASSAYHFTSKWQRIMVSLAGIMTELLLGAVATYVWLQSESGLVHAIAFNVILIAGVSTVLVNGNPLMRYDGYFILSDLIEIPNLAQRANQYMVYLSDRYIFGATDVKPALGVAQEKYWLLVYGLCSPVYRLLVMIGLIWFVAQQYFFIGVILALITVFLALVMPLWKGWKHIHSGGSLSRYREQAQRRLWRILAVLVLLLAVLPMPYHSVHQAIVWLPESSIIRAGQDGHVVEVLVQERQQVEAARTLLRLSNDDLSLQWEVARLQQEAIQGKLRQAYQDDIAKTNQLMQELESAQAKFRQLDNFRQALDVQAKTAGQWIPAESSVLLGRYVKRGDIIGYTINKPARVLRVAVTQDDLDLLESRLRAVDARFMSEPGQDFKARILRAVPQGQDTLLSAALGSNAGGQILVDPAQQEGTKTLTHYFDLEIELDKPASYAYFGDRAYVRFDLGWSPLLWQWTRKLRLLFLEKFYV